MRLLWLCNMVPGAVQEKISGSNGGGLWVDHVLQDLRKQDMEIRILCPGSGEEGRLDDKCSYAFFREGLPYVYLPQLEESFRKELNTYQPHVVHIWGTEFGHTLAMVNAAEKEGLLDHTVISIQGLCSTYTAHYAEGVPVPVQRRFTFRDAVRRDNILQQQKKFALRGELEVAALQKARHVIGRTDWDKACTSQINPGARYHFCNETLRPDFFEGQWRYEDCQKHRIFAPSSLYPIKGFHNLLEAFAQVVKDYPDARLSLPGGSFVTAGGVKGKLRQNSYHLYLEELAKKYGILDRIDFLGRLSGEGMKQAFLDANVFVLPSTIENSPNSLGEAMLLGVPCVASHVGGVANMLGPEEGFLYQSTAPYMLAHYIRELFAMHAPNISRSRIAMRERFPKCICPSGSC